MELALLFGGVVICLAVALFLLFALLFAGRSEDD